MAFQPERTNRDQFSLVFADPDVPVGLLDIDESPTAAVDLTSAGGTPDDEFIWCCHPPLQDCVRDSRQSGCFSGLCLLRAGVSSWSDLFWVLVQVFLIFAQFCIVCAFHDNTVICAARSIENQPNSKRTGDLVDHVAPPKKKMRMQTPPGCAAVLDGQCGWFHDLTQDGDVEANSGPSQARLSDYLAWATDLLQGRVLPFYGRLLLCIVVCGKQLPFSLVFESSCACQ
eukprot:5776120-Amphidinium_carterae.2